MKLHRPLVAAVAALTMVAASSLAHANYVSIARQSVTMRSGPGTKHTAQWTLSKGYPLKVTARSGKWVKVRDFENDTGWVYKPMTNQVRHHIVKASTANLRSGPATRYKLVGKAGYGEVLRALDQRDRWVKVRTDAGVQGWVARSLLWGW